MGVLAMAMPMGAMEAVGIAVVVVMAMRRKGLLIAASA
jgi:hypothetical protein